MSEEQGDSWWEGQGEAPAENSGGGEDLFSKLDADGDGVVTREEFEDAMGQGPILSGEVSTIPVDDASALGAQGDDGSVGGMSSSAWFAIGLIGAPMALGLVSLVLIAISDSLYEDGWFYDRDDSLEIEGTVQFGGEDYTVFQADFDGMPSEPDWYSVRIEWNEDYSRDFADCWADDVMEWDYDLSDDGQKWTLMHCGGESDGDAYVRLDGSTGNFATKRPDTPNLAWIDGESWGQMQGGADLLGFLGVAIWPVGLIAGSVWGFTKGHTSFAYGMLSSMVVAPLVLFGLCVIVFLAFVAGGF